MAAGKHCSNEDVLVRLEALVTAASAQSNDDALCAALTILRDITSATPSVQHQFSERLHHVIDVCSTANSVSKVPPKQHGSTENLFRMFIRAKGEQRDVFRQWVANADEDVVWELKAGGVSLQDRDANGMSALAAACYRGAKQEVICALIHMGCNVNAVDLKGRTPLWLECARRRDRDVMQALIDGGAGINMADDNGKTPLHVVLQNKFVQDVDQLVVVKVLLGAGADPNAKNGNGVAPLHTAIQHGHPHQVIELLLLSGATPNTTTPCGKLPIVMAVEAVCTAAQHLDLLEDTQPRYPLQQIREYARACDVVALLIGGKWAAVDYVSGSPMHLLDMVLPCMVTKRCDLRGNVYSPHTLYEALQESAELFMLYALVMAGANGTNVEHHMQAFYEQHVKTRNARCLYITELLLRVLGAKLVIDSQDLAEDKRVDMLHDVLLTGCSRTFQALICAKAGSSSLCDKLGNDVAHDALSSCLQYMLEHNDYDPYLLAPCILDWFAMFKHLIACNVLPSESQISNDLHTLIEFYHNGQDNGVWCPNERRTVALWCAELLYRTLPHVEKGVFRRDLNQHWTVSPFQRVTVSSPDVWSPEVHNQFPQRFQQDVATLLKCLHTMWSKGRAPKLGQDVVFEIVKHMAFPVIAWAVADMQQEKGNNDDSSEDRDVGLRGVDRTERTWEGSVRECFGLVQPWRLG